MTRSPVRVALRVVAATLLSVSGGLVALPTPAANATSPDLVISQVYGGGGNSGSTYTNDFVELFNRGASPASLAGWSVQYAAATGTVWQKTNLTPTTLAPGQYYLVQEAQGAGGTTPLPTPDVTGTILMSATAGKVALVGNQTLLAGVSCPIAGIVDFVGYGTTANCFEGGGPTPAPSNTTSVSRGGGGCTETDANNADFTAGAVNPRNTATTTAPCGGDAAPQVNSTVPANGTTNVAVGSNVSITFSEPVDVTGSWFSISGASSGPHTATVTGGPSIFTLDPDSDFASSETVSVTIDHTLVTDQDTTDPPDTMATDYLFGFTTIASDAAPSVASTAPTGGSGQNPVGTDIDVTFSEPVDVHGTWFTITGNASGSHTATVTGGPTTYTLDPDTDFSNDETVTVTILAAQVTDQDSNDPPDTMAANHVFGFGTPTRIHDVQGAAHLSPLAGRLLTAVPGVVTGLRSNGFYLQDTAPNYDADDATSEAIFVFTSSPPAVAVGDGVSVSGTPTEFRAGGAASTNLTVTELSSPGRVVVVNSSGNPLSTPVVIGTGGRVPPDTVIEDDATGDVETSGVFDPGTDGIDFYESLEDMRVQVNDALVVSPTVDFGSNRELSVVGDGGANAGVLSPLGAIVVRANDFNPERIILNDQVAGGPAIPLTPQTGDSIPGATVGFMDYNFGNYKLEVASLPTVVSGGITREVTTPAASGQLTVATVNVENLDPSDGPAKFSALASEIVNNLRSPDLISLEEIQDDNGAVDDGTVSSDTTLTLLRGAVVTAGGPTYQWRYIAPVNDQDGGEPGGNIRQVFFFRTDRGLSFVDRPGAGSTTANSVVSTPGGPQLRYSPGRIDPANSAWNSSRKPLAAEFTYGGDHLFVIANHFNSKGGDQPLFGHPQPPVRSSEVQRHQQAQIENDFVDQILALDPNANVIALGDLNDFAFSDTLSILEGGVLTDLGDTLPANEQYSFMFDGNAQDLDHVLVSGAMLGQTDTYDIVHMNVEFATSAADHDPAVAFFSMSAPATCSITGTSVADTIVGTQGPDNICARGGDDTVDGLGGNDVVDGGQGADSIVGGAGDDVLIGGQGADHLTGGSGADVVSGGAGDDRIDVVDGVGGNDAADGGGGSDACTGDPGDAISNCP
jgi:predicted extracellular nuclease